jgi:hypothetical protein
MLFKKRALKDWRFQINEVTLNYAINITPLKGDSK